MNKDSVIGFLTEFYDLLKTDPNLQLPSEDVFNYNLYTVNKPIILEWKSRVDAAMTDLAQRWLQEDVELESSIKQWSNTFYEEPEFTEALGKLSEIVEVWKKILTDALYKDPSVYTMPKEEEVQEKEEQKEEEKHEETEESEITDEEKEEEEIEN